MKVMVVLRPDSGVAEAVSRGDLGGLGVPLLGLLGSFELDTEFAPLVLPAQVPVGSAAAVDPRFLSALVVRGEIPDGGAALPGTLSGLPGIIGVFSDPALVDALICSRSPALGTETDVSNLLFAAPLRAAGMDGAGVRLAIVDPNGINVAYLAQRGRSQTVVAAWSSTSARVTTRPGAHPVGHGTAMAYDAGIAAPHTVLLDHRISDLSDALRAFDLLFQMMLADASARLVVNNSWSADLTNDAPPGDPANYSDNSLHPFNWMVTMLEAAGADILFAAGNCGRDCPLGACAGSNPIHGANSHPAVLTVAGVDTAKARVGYSSQGPGRLSAQKPDVAAYTHFRSSEVRGPGSPDPGTSTACAVAAGVVAAVRSAYSPSQLTPEQLRALIRSSALDRGAAGFDHDYGWGTIDVPALLAQMPPRGSQAPTPVPPWPGRPLRSPPTMVGPDVALWQQRMSELGFPLVVDGKYGPKSKAACMAFQQQRELVVDGIVGPKTWAAAWSEVPVPSSPVPVPPVG